MCVKVIIIYKVLTNKKERSTHQQKKGSQILMENLWEEIYMFNKFLETLRTLVVVKEVQIKNNL